MKLTKDEIKLIRNLQLYTLDPRFERFGNFVLEAKEGKMHFWGNFYDYSAVFNVVTGDRKVIDVICKLIKANQQSPEYLAAKREYAEVHERQHPNGYIESIHGPYAAY